MSQDISFLPLLNNNSSVSAQYQKKSSINKINKKLVPYENWQESWKRIYYKEYPRFPKFPLIVNSGRRLKYSLMSVLKNRSSQREFSSEKISFQTLSVLLNFSVGINRGRKDNNSPKRFFPSGGARFPNEVYILVNKNRVAGLKQASYHYSVKRNCLEEMFEIRDYKKLCRSIFVQDFVTRSSLTICISAVFNRSQVKYGERGYRFCLMEAGHIGQNIYLISASLRLKCCALGGFSDYKINESLELNGTTESVLYMLAIGK